MTPISLPTPTLHTARLRLRPFDDADANDLFALHSSANVLRYWDAPPWTERARSERRDVDLERGEPLAGGTARAGPRALRTPSEVAIPR